MPTVTMTMDEYNALLMAQGFAGLTDEALRTIGGSTPIEVPAKQTRRTTKYQRTYKKEFRKVAPRFKMKNGKWKKDGFKAAVKAAHRATRKILG